MRVIQYAFAAIPYELIFFNGECFIVNLLIKTLLSLCFLLNIKSWLIILLFSIIYSIGVKELLLLYNTYNT